jgi:beta-alanine degradation protein BauB
MQARIVCMFACLGGVALLGQDVLKVAPTGVVKVEYEDAQVRVLRFKEPPGSKLEMHSHPAYVSVGLTDDVFHYTFPDGKSADDKSKAGEVAFSRAVTHAGQNMGKTASEAIMVELKTKPAPVAAGDMAQANPTMCKVELENAYVRVTRVKVPPHGMLKMHSHPGSNVVVYLSGGQLKSTSAAGKVEQATVAPGTVRANPAGKHSNENVGDKPSEAVLIELKTASK